MTVREYLKDRGPAVLVNVFSMIAVTVYLAAGMTYSSTIILLISGWCAVTIAFFTIGYVRRNRHFRNMEETLFALDKPYLLGEVLEKPYRQEDRKYRELLCKSNKSVIEAIYKLEDEQREYREYIENWVHNLKMPITAIELCCENQDEQGGKALTRKIRPELTKIENCAESVLYYARADAVYQDYLIKPLNLEDVVTVAVMRNKSFLIQNHMSVDISISDSTVYCDEKWLEFILGQIIFNGVKYRKGEQGKLLFTGTDVCGGFCLAVEDNGIGIKESEIERVFDKGFTGTNGRSRQKATGIGLYLCRRLADCLGIQISAQSQEGTYTRIKLFFPKSDYHHM